MLRRRSVCLTDPGRTGQRACRAPLVAAGTAPAAAGRRRLRPRPPCPEGNSLRNSCAPSRTSRRLPSGCSPASGSWTRSVRFRRRSAALPSRGPAACSTPAPASSRRRPPGGAERLLEELGRRDELVAASEPAVRDEAEARAAVERARRRGRRGRRRPRARGVGAPDALRAAAEAADGVSRSEWLIAPPPRGAAGRPRGGQARRAARRPARGAAAGRAHRARARGARPQPHGAPHRRRARPRRSPRTPTAPPPRSSAPAMRSAPAATPSAQSSRPAPPPARRPPPR